MVSITQIKEFIKVSQSIEFKGKSRKEKYEWIETVLLRFRYFSLRKKEKSILKGYIMKMTGFSDAQLTRLIAKKKHWGRILADTTKRHRFPLKYTPEDVARLIETDTAHDRLSGPATKRIFDREYAIFKKEAFRRLKDISVAHIYNFRKTRQYQSLRDSSPRPNPRRSISEKGASQTPRGNRGFSA